MKWEDYNKGEYSNHGTRKETVEKIKSRSIGPDGKVYQGPAGIRLQNKKLARQRYFERN